MSGLTKEDYGTSNHDGALKQRYAPFYCELFICKKGRSEYLCS